MKRNRYAASILTLVCALSLLCAGCARRTDYLPETSPNQSAGTAETPQQPATELEKDEKNSEREANIAYLSILTAEREHILGYDWQRGTVFDEEIYEARPAAPATPVVFADVWGDEMPELIFAAALTNGEERYAAKLRVFTWDEEGARELYDDVVDSQVGGGSGYRLFQTGADKSLWLYTADYGEGMSETYIHFTTEGRMRPQMTCNHYAFPDYLDDDDGTAEQEALQHHYLYNDEVCTREAYESGLPAEGEQAKGLLMRNAAYYEYDADMEKPADAFDFPYGTAMRCDDAIRFLRGKLDITLAEADEAAFFASLPKGFTFASGAGGWSSELFINPDGTFTGDYHDSDMGDDGEDYPDGTIYVCSFSGRFGQVRRVDEYTYSMRLEELDIDPTEAEEWIEDGVRFVASGPYGLEGADEVMVYLPGSCISDLPYGFTSWVSMFNAWGYDGEDPVLLPFYGLYNVVGEEGWSGWD